MIATRCVRARLGCALWLAGATAGCALSADTNSGAERAALTSAAAEALPGLPGAWIYSEIAGARCRDGSPAGVATNLSPGSKKLMIYLEGGGICLEPTSCSVNFANVSGQVLALGSVVGVGGWFDRNAIDNPLRDFNFVYVPYCTGDLHSGANPFGDVPGVGPQLYVGYLNLQKFLPRIRATFPGVSDVIVSGGSAGGVGALRTSLLVQRAFPELRVRVVSDSGPPMSKEVYAPCVQRRERELFALDQTIFAECGDACPNPDNAWLDFAMFVATQLQDRPIGMIQALDDWGICGFVGVGHEDCTDPRSHAHHPVGSAARRSARSAHATRRVSQLRHVLPSQRQPHLDLGCAGAWVRRLRQRARRRRQADGLARAHRARREPGPCGPVKRCGRRLQTGQPRRVASVGEIGAANYAATGGRPCPKSGSSQVARAGSAAHSRRP